MLKNFIERVIKEAQLDEVISDDGQGSWLFSVDERTIAHISEDHAFITLNCDLGPAPKQAKELEAMLHSNLASRGTMGSVLALDPAVQKALLWRQLPKGCDYEWFRNELEDFITNAEYWSYFVRGEELPK